MLSGKEDWCYMIDDMLTQETRILKKNSKYLGSYSTDAIHHRSFACYEEILNECHNHGLESNNILLLFY